jgi:hypothetical protein
VALAAIKGELTLAQLAEQFDVSSPILACSSTYRRAINAAA